MAYNKQYYQDKQQKLQQKNQQIVQRLINSAFDFVNEISDWQERMNDLKESERLSIINEAAKEQSPLPTTPQVKTDEKMQTPGDLKGNINIGPTENANSAEKPKKANGTELKGIK